MLSESFYIIKSLKKEKSSKILQANRLITKLALIATAIGGRNLFSKWKQHKKVEANILNILKIVRLAKHRSLDISFNLIYLRKFSIHTNALSGL